MATHDEGFIPYQQWMNDALISVARKTIVHIIQHGLSHGHKLYITFHTSHAGVAMSASLKKRYPEKMTILLQHHFRNLKSDAVSFSVTLAFSGIEQRLRIPYLALHSMQDPSVNMTLHFNNENTPTPTSKESPPSPPISTEPAPSKHALKPATLAAIIPLPKTTKTQKKDTPIKNTNNLITLKNKKTPHES
ncbi:MAG: hypothetical protein GDA50_08865 [Alphaproteobacteria bacterium GM202ARS2]|nr:hypothetical protein [Alphaproteobacteria bacterium GM202ARS2]